MHMQHLPNYSPFNDRVWSLFPECPMNYFAHEDNEESIAATTPRTHSTPPQPFMSHLPAESGLELRSSLNTCSREPLPADGHSQGRWPGEAVLTSLCDDRPVIP